MALHRLSSVTIGVPNVTETAAYYTDFGLIPAADGWFHTRDGGRQLRLLSTPRRRLLELRVGVDSADDLRSAATRLSRLGVPYHLETATLAAVEPVTRTRAVLEVLPRLQQRAVPPTPYNGPGRLERVDTRAPGVLRVSAVLPRKLGHAVLGTPDLDTPPSASSATASVS